MIKTLQKQHMKYKEPTKGKGIRKLFRENDYKVYLVDEYRTSCMCSKCCEGKCEKFITREDPKPYKKGNIIVHGALKKKDLNIYVDSNSSVKVVALTESKYTYF